MPTNYWTFSTAQSTDYTDYFFDLMKQKQKPIPPPPPEGYELLDGSGELMDGDIYMASAGWNPVRRQDIECYKLVSSFLAVAESPFAARHVNHKFNLDSPPPPPDGFEILGKKAIPILGDMVMDRRSFKWRKFYGFKLIQVDELVDRGFPYISLARRLEKPSVEAGGGYRILAQDDMMIMGDEYFADGKWLLAPVYGIKSKELNGITIRRYGPDPGAMFENLHYASIASGSTQRFVGGNCWEMSPSNNDRTELTVFEYISSDGVSAFRRLKDVGEGYRVMGGVEWLEEVTRAEYLNPENKWVEYEPKINHIAIRVRDFVREQRTIVRTKITNETENADAFIPKIISSMIRKNPNKEMIRGIVRANLSIILSKEALEGGAKSILSFITEHYQKKSMEIFGCRVETRNQNTFKVMESARVSAIENFHRLIGQQSSCRHITVSYEATDVTTCMVGASRQDRVKCEINVPDQILASGESGIMNWIARNHAGASVISRDRGKLVLGRPSDENSTASQIRASNVSLVAEEMAHRKIDQ